MAILTRIKRLFQADIHAILDAAEEPEVLLRQAIREMQEAVDLEAAALERKRKQLAALQAAETRERAELESVEADLELSLREGNEELSRKTVARKLACRKRAVALRERIDRLGEDCAARSSRLDDRRVQLDAVLQKAKALAPFASGESAADVAESILAWREAGVSGPGRTAVSDEEIELEWLRIRSQQAKGGES